MLEVEHLCFSYGKREVLRGVDLRTEPGELVFVLGANGAGKSTLFLNLNGVLQPSAGEILLDGALVKRDRKGLTELRRRVGIVFQDPDDQLFSADVYRDISFGAVNLGLPEAEVRRRVEAAMERTGVSHLRDKPTHALSFGQKKRAAIAGVLVMEPEVLILDEPTSSLTANEVESLFRIMRELKEQGVALVYISHKMDEIKVIADEVTIMRDGHYIGKWDVASMTKEQIIAKMVGRELSNLYPPLENHPSDEVMMKVED